MSNDNFLEYHLPLQEAKDGGGKRQGGNLKNVFLCEIAFAFLCCKETCVLNLSLDLRLEPFEKLLVVGGVLMYI